MPGDVDAADQSLLGETRNLRKGRIPDHEMWSELASLGGAHAENGVLAQLEPDMRGGHQQRRQAPERDEQLARNAAPMPATQQDDDDQDACDDKRDVSGAA